MALGTVASSCDLTTCRYAETWSEMRCIWRSAGGRLSYFLSNSSSPAGVQLVSEQDSKQKTTGMPSCGVVPVAHVDNDMRLLYTPFEVIQTCLLQSMADSGVQSYLLKGN
jgi:hypothetical protein